MNKLFQMKKLEEEVKKCENCKLYKTRKNVVFGMGNVYSKIIFIGEAPGKNEDEKGTPFCGKAGKILDNLFSLISLKREDVYITSVLKCRPPKNRKPQKDEIEICGKYLQKQIEIINPDIICCLGNVSLEFIFKKFNIEEKPEISKFHGKFIEINGKKILPFFHPAFAIYNPEKFEVIKKDFIKLKTLIC